VKWFTRGVFSKRLCSGLISLFLLLDVVVLSLAQEVRPKPSTEPQAGPGLAVGSHVIFKDGNTPLNVDGRLVPLVRYFWLTVERVDGDRISVASPDGILRGTAGVDQVVLTDRAIDYFDREIAKNPRNADAYWMRARLRGVANPDLARNDLDRAIQLEPNRARYYVTLGDIYINKSQLDLAISAYSRAIQLDPAMATAYKLRATAWALKGEVERTKPDLDEAIRLDPTDQLAWSGRYTYWMRHGNLENALKDITEVIRLNPNNPVWHLWRGDLRTRMGQREEALADFTESTRLQPNYDFALAKRGNALRKLGRYDEAIADFTEAIKLNPKVAWFYVSRGDAWLDKTDFDEAIKDYTTALGLEPNRSYIALGLDLRKDRIYLKRATARLKKHDRPGEVADLTEAIQLDPKNADYRSFRGHAWSRQGDHLRAIADFDEAIRIEPTKAAHFTARGFEWAKDLEPDKALADFNRSLELDPKYHFAYLGRGNVRELSGQYDKAAANFDEMVRVLPENPSGHRELARILATCPVASVRDGKRAVAEATVACELTRWRDLDFIDTLAAACAEAMDFDAAVKWEIRAIEMWNAQDIATATSNLRKEFAMRDRLSLYKRRQPYHANQHQVRP
jgi:tetratricopeptide (TPR) repeat protein